MSIRKREKEGDLHCGISGFVHLSIKPVYHVSAIQERQIVLREVRLRVLTLATPRRYNGASALPSCVLYCCSMPVRLNGEEPDPELFMGIFRRLLTDPLEELMELLNRKGE